MMRRGTLRPTSRIVDWRDATADEIYMFFAIVLATGVVVKSRIEEYWNKEPFLLSTPEFTNTMTYDRFMLLNKCLHFQDNDLVDSREMTKSEAKLFKLKPVIDHLNDKFASLFSLGQNVALDESLTKWKGSSDINVFSRSSSASIGIKVYELCDCHTGYLWRFEAKTESDTTPVETSSIMLRLLRGLEDRGHTIWMDSNYSSPLLARELKAHGFDCVGPLRTNKQYVPKQVKKLENSDLKPNEIVGYTSGDVDVLAWRDRKIVTLISTYHGLATVEAGDIRKPAVVCDYVNWISKVDRKDQMLSAHPIERKRTRVWYKKFFRRLLNASVLNAYILHRHNPSNRQNPALSHREFRKTLIVEIIKYHMTAKASVNSTDHFPNEYGKNLESKAKKVEGLRRKCAVCKRRTRNYCEGCNTAMCLYACFKQHHSGKRHVLSDAEIVTGS
ncbi:piggyBac transposable element-derived protein 4 [Plutella xylostella]|uniref:piggyBac transposable element-derived protein 4 n=1 Tax=Plutella xylostella TaxID=51655 RepID=UPI0020322387|nr:piggyBac transposable element-derived protein 4 [Plutella xylostella]